MGAAAVGKEKINCGAHGGEMLKSFKCSKIYSRILSSGFFVSSWMEFILRDSEGSETKILNLKQ